LTAKQKWQLIESAEAVLGLSLTHPPIGVREKDTVVAKEREEARKNKDFAKADELRIHMENSGYRVYDGALETTYIQIRQ
jgi:cysteinyl-tRNA synthetase